MSSSYHMAYHLSNHSAVRLPDLLPEPLLLELNLSTLPHQVTRDAASCSQDIRRRVATDVITLTDQCSHQYMRGRTLSREHPLEKWKLEGVIGGRGQGNSGNLPTITTRCSRTVYLRASCSWCLGQSHHGQGKAHHGS